MKKMLQKVFEEIIADNQDDVLDKIYNEQEKNGIDGRRYIVISSEEYETIQSTFEAYDKFKNEQKGKKRIALSASTITAMQQQGLSNRKIANALGVSEGTIRNRLKNSKNSLINFNKIMQESLRK